MSDLRATDNQQVNAQPLRPAPKGTDGVSGKKLPQASTDEARVDLEVTQDGQAPNTADKVQQRQQQKEEPNEVAAAVARINDYLQKEERSLNFQLDEESGITVIKVYDATTQEIIRQIPSEEMVSLAQKLNKEEPLSLFSAQV